MRANKQKVFGKIEQLKAAGFKVHWTRCNRNGRYRWWVRVENKNKPLSKVESFGSTREVYTWLDGIMSGLWLVR